MIARVGKRRSDHLVAQLVFAAPEALQIVTQDLDHAAKLKDEADAAYQALLKDPSKFDLMARTMSDENSAKTTGGKQPFYDPTSAIEAIMAL